MALIAGPENASVFLPGRTSDRWQMGGAKSTTAALVSYVTTTGHAAHWMAYVFLISLLGGNFAVRFSSSLERDLLWAG
jgi:hypothetical protein